MQLRLELITVPVSDVDRAKAFYVDQVGFSAEQDFGEAATVDYAFMWAPHREPEWPQSRSRKTGVQPGLSR